VVEVSVGVGGQGGGTADVGLDVVDYYLAVYFMLLLGIFQCFGAGCIFDIDSAVEKSSKASVAVLTIGYWAIVIIMGILSLYEVQVVLALDVAHLLVDLLGGYASSEEGGGGEVSSVSGVRGASHVLGIENLLGELGDGEGFVLLGAAEGGVQVLLKEVSVTVSVAMSLTVSIGLPGMVERAATQSTVVVSLPPSEFTGGDGVEVVDVVLALAMKVGRAC